MHLFEQHIVEIIAAPTMPVHRFKTGGNLAMFAQRYILRIHNPIMLHSFFIMSYERGPDQSHH
jgi:hypothetical protein